VYGQRDPELAGGQAAVALVLIGRRPQSVVDVQRRDEIAAGDGDRQIQQAGRVAPAGIQHDDAPPRGQEPVRLDTSFEVAHAETRPASVRG
jgi:hypothetical protein